MSDATLPASSCSGVNLIPGFPCGYNSLIGDSPVETLAGVGYVLDFLCERFVERPLLESESCILQDNAASGLVIILRLVQGALKFEEKRLTPPMPEPHRSPATSPHPGPFSGGEGANRS